MRGDSCAHHSVLTCRTAPGDRPRRECAAAGRAGRRPVSGALARRGAHRRRDAQPRRGVVPPAVREARRRRRGRARRGARHRRHPRQDAEPGHRLGWHAHRHRRRGRARVAPRAGGRRPGGHPGLALADAPDHHRRSRPLGRPLGAGARGGHRSALRPLHRRPPAGGPLARPGPDGHGRLRGTGPRRAGGGGVRRPRHRADGRRARWRRQVGLAVPGRGATTPGQGTASGWCRSSGRPRCCARAAWPMPW